MKAVLAKEFSASWEVTECADPTPGPGDLLIAVEASGVCYSDVQQLTNAHYSGVFPRIPGHEPVGTVIACGENVQRFGTGDRVGVAYAQRWCGRCIYCEHGRYEHCPTIDRTGISIDGGHAELMVLDAAAAEAMPAGLDPAEAAPVLCAGFTAYSGLRDAEVEPGERVAVVGIGGLGHLGLQYANALGCEVIAVTRDERKATDLKRLGADHVVIDEDGAGQALERAGGVDAILHTGNRLSPDIVRGLRPYGRLALTGVSESQIAATCRELIFKNVRVIGSSQGPRHRLREVLALHKRAQVKTQIQTFQLDRACDAYEAVASGSVRYRAVITP